MNGLREGLRTRSMTSSLGGVRAPTPDMLARAVAVASEAGETGLPKVALEQIQKKIISAIQDDQIATLTRRDLREGGRGLFSEP
jgi:hypothetical protein